MNILEHYWQKAEEELRLALKELPQEELKEVEDYLECKQFLFAWEEMEGIANRLKISSAEFWRPMAKSAGFMLAANEESGYL